MTWIRSHNFRRLPGGGRARAFAAGFFAALLGVAEAPGWGEGQGQPPRRVDLRAVLIQKAQDEGINFIWISSSSGPSRRPAAGQPDLGAPFQSLAETFGLKGEAGPGLTWLSPPAQPPEPGMPPPAHLQRWTSLNAPAVERVKRVVKAAQTSLGQAFMLTLTEEQRRLLERPWHPRAIVTAYDGFLGEGVADAINMGGFVDGSVMTEFQRRLCAALAFAADMGGIPLEWLATCSEIGFGDFQPTWAERAEWRPDVMVRTYQIPPRSISLRMQGGSVATIGLSLPLPAHTLQGDELSSLVAWARLNLPPLPPWLPVPNFTCRRQTDGPTRSLTDLMDLSEADLEVRIPQDIRVATMAELLAYFTPFGYTFVLPPGVSQQSPVVTLDPERSDGVLTLLTALNSVIDDWPDRLWKREGNAFVMVYAKWSDREYREDPRDWLDPSLLGNPVTLTSLQTPLPDFVAELRKQTGAPLGTSTALEHCRVWMIAHLRDVPLGSILATLASRLGTAWEKEPGGEVMLVHPDFIQPERSGSIPVGAPLRPEEWGQYQQRVAGVALSLLLEALPAQPTEGEPVGLNQMPEVCRWLLIAACQAASGLTDLGTRELALIPAGRDEQARSLAGLRVEDRTYTVTAISPPTIPPNPLSSGYLVASVFGKPRTRHGPAPPGPNWAGARNSLHADGPGGEDSLSARLVVWLSSNLRGRVEWMWRALRPLW